MSHVITPLLAMDKVTKRLVEIGGSWMAALTYLTIRSAAFVAERIPLALGDRLATLAALTAFHVARRNRRVVRRNLRRVVGDGKQLDRAVHDAFLSYARYWLETFRLGRYSQAELLQMVQCSEPERLDALLKSERGLVVVSPHFGVYDLAVAWLGVKGYRITTVAEVLRPRALFDWFVSRRERLGRGIRVLPASPGAAAFRTLLRAVQSGGNVVLLADRDLRQNGVELKLFGETTTMPIGPALLAARTGAPLVAAAIYLNDNAATDIGPQKKRYVIEFEELDYKRSGDVSADIFAITRLIGSAFERIIRKAPEHWHMFSRNWPADEA